MNEEGGGMSVDWNEERIKSRMDSVRRLLLTILVTVIVGFVISPAEGGKPDWNTYSKLIKSVFNDPRWMYSKAIDDLSRQRAGHEYTQVEWNSAGRTAVTEIVPPAIFATGEPTWALTLEPARAVMEGRDTLEGLMKFWDRARLAGCWYVAQPDMTHAAIVRPVADFVPEAGNPVFRSTRDKPSDSGDRGMLYADVFDCTKDYGTDDARQRFCDTNERGLGYVLTADVPNVGQVLFPVKAYACPRTAPLLGEVILREAGLDPKARYTFQDLLGDSYYDAPLVDNLMQAAGGKGLGPYRQRQAYLELIRQISEVRERVAKEKASTQLGGVEMSIQLARTVFPWFMAIVCLLFFLASEGFRSVAAVLGDEPSDGLLRHARCVVLLGLATAAGIVCTVVSPGLPSLGLGALSAALVALAVRRNPRLPAWLI